MYKKTEFDFILFHISVASVITSTDCIGEQETSPANLQPHQVQSAIWSTVLQTINYTRQKAALEEISWLATT